MPAFPVYDAERKSMCKCDIGPILDAAGDDIGNKYRCFLLTLKFILRFLESIFFISCFVERDFAFFFVPFCPFPVIYIL